MSIPKVNTNPPGGPALNPIVRPVRGINKLPDQVITHVVLKYLNGDDLKTLTDVDANWRRLIASSMSARRKIREAEIAQGLLGGMLYSFEATLASERRDYAWLERHGLLRDLKKQRDDFANWVSSV